MVDNYKNFDHVRFLINNINLVDKNITSKKESWKFYIGTIEKYVFFDWKSYISMYPDLKKINNYDVALEHYIKHGKNENRKYLEINLDIYDWELYYNTYNIPNLEYEKRAVIKHYLLHGQNENKIMNIKHN